MKSDSATQHRRVGWHGQRGGRQPVRDQRVEAANAMEHVWFEQSHEKFLQATPEERTLARAPGRWVPADHVIEYLAPLVGRRLEGVVMSIDSPSTGSTVVPHVFLKAAGMKWIELDWDTSLSVFSQVEQPLCESCDEARHLDPRACGLIGQEISEVKWFDEPAGLFGMQMLAKDGQVLELVHESYDMWDWQVLFGVSKDDALVPIHEAEVTWTALPQGSAAGADLVSRPSSDVVAPNSQVRSWFGGSEPWFRWGR